VEVAAIEHAQALLGDPLFLGQGLALRAVAIATRVVGGVLEAATVTSVEMAAEGSGSALREVCEDAPLLA
jgi:hypothetical protein